MLCYRESHYSGDDKMSRVVLAMKQWLQDPTHDSTASLEQALAKATGKLRYDIYRELSMPDVPEIIGSDCPADFAGDSIVWAARALFNLNEREQFQDGARRSLTFATEAVSRMYAERNPLDDNTDLWLLAQKHLGDQIARELNVLFSNCPCN